MKRILTLVTAFSLIFTLVVPAFAYGTYEQIKEKPDQPITSSGEFGVRVNGYLVEFPDEKPFVNSDNRTMIPVRFVTEALGAKVSWSSKQNAAIIEKDGVKIVLPVGRNEMTVTRDGKESTKELDTSTVLQNGRTFVPIRAVAEELGAWVSFSSAYNTVEIYNDVLSPSEIDQLHSLSVHSYWQKNVMDSKKAMLTSSSKYEDLSEYALRNNRSVYDYELKTPNGLYFNTKTGTHEDKLNFMYKAIIEGMEQDYTRTKYGITATFRTDESCLFTNPAGDSTWLNYGYLTINVGPNADVASYASMKKTPGCDLSSLQPGKSYTFLIESSWEILMGKDYGLSRVAVYNRTNGVDERWA